MSSKFSADAVRRAIDRERSWLAHARPGETHVYHTGLLTEDRVDTIYTTTHQNSDGTFEMYRATQPVEPFDSIATLYAEASERGLVVLTQRRLGPAEYEYRATRTNVKEQ